MSQQTASRWIMAAVAAALGGACGCMGPAAPLTDDPLRGGRPVPVAKASSAAIDDPIPMPPADTTRSPAALTSVGQRTPRKESTTQTSATEPVSNVETYEQLQERLRDHGVTWQILKTNSGRDNWRFECCTAESPSSTTQGWYRADAVGPNGLAAIRAVIAEIEAERKERGQQ